MLLTFQIVGIIFSSANIHLFLKNADFERIVLPYFNKIVSLPESP